MTKEEKIKFVIKTFESAIPSYMNGKLGLIIQREDEFWLDQYITRGSFEDSLQLDSNLESAYKAAMNISRM